jgi:hypothetical protein
MLEKEMNKTLVMRPKILALVATMLLLFSASMTSAQCAPDEDLFMQCSLDAGGKQVSVCFGGGTTHYRFGSTGQSAELELTTPYSLLGRYRLLTDEIEEKVGETIEFANGAYSYTTTMGFYSVWPVEKADQWGSHDFGNLPASIDGGADFGSVVVAQNGEEIASLDCQPSSITWNRNALYQSLDAAGIKWYMGLSGYFEWHDDRFYPYSGLPTTVPPFVCPYTDEFPINFSSSDIQDVLSIEIVGHDCDTADIVLTVTTAAGDVVHSSSAKALSYTYEFQGADGVRAMLMSFMQDLPRNISELPQDEDMRDGSGYHDVNVFLVERARSLNLPLFCHQAGKSFSNCFVYADGKSQLLFSEGS